jgi:DNA-binding winged helix-turn-helix (wHTH) protein
MTVRFGEFVFDAGARQLRRGAAEVRLSPKAFDLLRTLLARRPDVLSKADLLAAIWPGTFVVEANLNVVVAEIRRALGDDRQAPRFIRTVHGVGYAFCGQALEIKDGEAAAAVRSEARSWLTQKGRTFPLSEGTNMIGRDPRSAVWLEDESVSRRHARIRIDRDVAELEDLESTNGTFLNRQPLDSAARLADGDIVRVGSLRLTFRMLSDKAARTRRLRRESSKK